MFCIIFIISPLSHIYDVYACDSPAHATIANLSMKKVFFVFFCCVLLCFIIILYDMYACDSPAHATIANLSMKKVCFVVILLFIIFSIMLNYMLYFTFYYIYILFSSILLLYCIFN